MFKTRLDTFGNQFGHFWNFESFLIFSKIFDNSNLQGTLGKKKTFSKKSPQNIFKTRLDTFDNYFGHLWNFESFFIFLKIFDNSTLQGTMSKKTFSEKLTKNMSKTQLKTFGNDFRLFCNFEKFLIFFENFRQLDPPRNTEQKKLFQKNRPQNMFKTRLDTFGKILGIFAILKVF